VARRGIFQFLLQKAKLKASRLKRTSYNFN
jgi:hypothetical protein